ncbi:MAG: sigma-70 family RNA polymerase sigma factor [Acidobacteriia bacterium]|nr:sigma-70 family RNA polymerase sigma factor [Terriglobia bacterium]
MSLTGAWDGTGGGGVRSSDALLVEGLRSGEEQAYETLIARFEQPIYNLVVRLLGDSSDASDVVQEVFLKVFRSIGNFRGQSSLKTWVYRIAVNETHNYRRWFGRRRGHEVGLEDEQFEGMTLEQLLPDPGRSPFEATLDHETRTRIEQALARIKPAFRSAVVLRDVEGLTYEEIAEVLHISLGTVKSRILRGREALREQLQNRLETRLEQWAPQPVDSV